jgi:hypothetical protein
MDLTPKQQTSEAIRQAETILILTGQHPSVDQVTAVVALAAILRKFGKTATAVISDNPPASVAVLETDSLERNLGGQRDFVLKLDVTKVELDKLRYEVQDGKLNIYLTPFKGNFAPSDVTFAYGDTNINYDLVIALGVPTRARIDRLYEQNAGAFSNIPLVNLDFHRSNENYGAVNLIEPNASSLCEMLVALSESLQSGIIDAEIATALLMGIVASTDRFTAAHTSPKSLTVAAQMMAAGARQQAVVKALYRDGRQDSRGGSDKSSDRSDRVDRSERGERREGERREHDRRDNDRKDDRSSGQSNQGGRGQNQPNQRDSQPSQRENQPAQREPQPVERPEEERQPAVAAADVAATAPERTNDRPVRDETPAEAQEPIIQPGHIELSEEPEAPIASEAPEGSETALEHADQSNENVVQSEAPAQIERPQGIPMADFAAAAEMFNQQPQQGSQSAGQDSPSGR